MSKSSKNYYVPENQCSCDGSCESCKRNQCGYCTHYGVRVSKSNNCEQVEKRAQAANNMRY